MAHESPDKTTMSCLRICCCKFALHTVCHDTGALPVMREVMCAGSTFLLIILAAGYHDAGLVRSVKWSVLVFLLTQSEPTAFSVRGGAPVQINDAR